MVPAAGLRPGRRRRCLPSGPGWISPTSSGGPRRASLAVVVAAVPPCGPGRRGPLRPARSASSASCSMEMVAGPAEGSLRRWVSADRAERSFALPRPAAAVVGSAGPGSLGGRLRLLLCLSGGRCPTAPNPHPRHPAAFSGITVSVPCLSEPRSHVLVGRSPGSAFSAGRAATPSAVGGSGGRSCERGGTPRRSARPSTPTSGRARPACSGRTPGSSRPGRTGPACAGATGAAARATGSGRERRPAGSPVVDCLA